MDPRRHRTTWWALALLGAVELAALVIGALVAGVRLGDLVDGYAVTNAAFGLGFGGCGLLLAWQLPANPIGWLFSAGALAHLTTAAVTPWAFLGVDEGWPVWVIRLLATVLATAWPVGIGLLFPLALLLFPTGRCRHRAGAGPPGRWSHSAWCSSCG